MKLAPFSEELLRIDCKEELAKIIALLRERVLRQFKKKGLIVAISGGVDSSVVVALAVLACGKEKVLGLQMPERHSSSETLSLSQVIAKHLEIETVHEDISGMARAGNPSLCYQASSRAISIGYFPLWRSQRQENARKHGLTLKLTWGSFPRRTSSSASEK